MRYLAPLLLVFALLSPYAHAENSGWRVRATISNDKGDSEQLTWPQPFDTEAECKAFLEAPSDNFKTQTGQLAAAVEAQGLKLDIACSTRTTDS